MKYPKTLITLLALTLSSCGDQAAQTTMDATLTQCQAGSAAIAVRDGFLQALCGCQAITAGTIFTPPNPLNCTVNAGTQVVFRFEDTFLQHQIRAVGAPNFPATNYIDPNSGDTRPASTVTFPNTGTFLFQDVFNNALNGSIVVI